MATTEHTYANSWGLCIGATINVVWTTTKAASLGGEGQRMCRPCEKIFGYPHKRLHAPLHEAAVAEGQAREAVTYSYRTLLSNSGNWKK